MVIKLENLCRDIEKKENEKPTVTINDINVELESGSINGLIGPTFSGKSSLLFLIAGLLESTSGSIYFGNKDVTKLPAEKREVGFVFQNYQLYPHLTVLQNIMFPLLVKKVPKKLAKEKALNIAEIMGLTDILDKKPKSLLAHKRVQVAIARAYVKSPNIVLLDEPLSHLDIRYKNETRDLIKKIQRETKITTIFVSQNQEDAIYISDYLMLMNEGALKAYGTPEELYGNPENQFVAEFLGNPAINIIKCQYNDDEESVKKAQELNKEEKVESKVVEPVSEKKPTLLDEDIDLAELGLGYGKASSEVKKEEEPKEELPEDEVEEKSEEEKKIEAEVPKGILSFGDQIFLDDKTPTFGERMILTKDTRLAVRPEAFEFSPNGKYVMHVESFEFTGRENLVRFTLPGIDYVFNCLAPIELKLEPGMDIKFDFKRYFIFDIIGRRIR